MYLSSLVFFIFGNIFLQCDAEAVKRSTDCDSHGLCSECLQQLGCVWCIKPIEFKKHDNDSSEIHCMESKFLEQNLCPKELLINPISKKVEISSRPLQSVQDDTIQITPQRINLTMRLGEEKKINFQYAQAQNYPIDLYYIMDLSASMEDHREKLAKLGNKLAETMKEITTNFRIGFGSFVDKVEMPFVSTVKSKLRSPCTLNKNGRQIKCVSPYSFKNHMSLSNNHTKFSFEVSQSQVSGNLDTPEGGFDALIQAIVCKKEIGWRDQARHLLVFSTDAVFHIAGDGKLTGVIEPNDAKCHLANDEYVAYLDYDYPSVSQLNYVAKKNNINLIFAIVKSKKEDLIGSYNALSAVIENSNVGGLDEKSGNVIDLVLDNYNKIVDSVLIDINSTQNIDVKISSNCTKPIERGCSDIHVGEVVNFTATIKPLKCQGSDRKPTIITFKPEGIDERMVIELNVICGCDCEKPSDPSFFEKSPKCSGYGDLVCGVCSCPVGRHGDKCECDGQNTYRDDKGSCTAHPGAKECSGLGTCKCGKCECFSRPEKNQKITGKFCQCDNYSCNRQHGLLCAGNGECVCGNCVCDAGFTGLACECPDGNSTCMKEGHGADGICSGKGVCKCGRCECFESYYTGDYCEQCPTCKERCNELKDCVDCTVFKTGSLRPGDCDIRCAGYRIEEVEDINEDELEARAKLCRSLDKDSCTTLYKYSYDADKNLIVSVQKTKSCPPNALVWTLFIIGSILLAGLIMLLTWKIFTTVHDRREYVKFENEKKNVRWHRNENPLYKGATTTFQNPYYEK